MLTPIGTTGVSTGSAGQAAQGASSGDEALTFADALQKALGQVEDLQSNATDIIGRFVRGEDVEMHQVMAAAEEAGIALEMLVEMRNKLVEAYRTIVSMQV